VVGNLAEEKLIETIERNLEILPKPRPTGIKVDYKPEPAFQEIVRSDSVDEALQQARLVMLWLVPGLAELSESDPLDVLAAILGQGRTSRLFRRLREQERLVTQISASNLTQGIQGAFYISAQLDTQNLAQVEKAIIEEIVKIQEDGITEAELERIQTQAINRHIFSSEKPSDRANLYGYYYSQMQDLTHALNYPQLIQNITRDKIQQAARKYLNPNAYGIVIMRPGN
jgi:predicted Zn-dependent peptidase